MNQSLQSSTRVQFGEFEVDLRAGEVRKHGIRVRLQEKPFQILALLLERAGDLVTREELRQRLWSSDTFVDFDANLNTSLNRLRQSLGDTADEQLFIKTIPRQGYRFIATVTPVESRPEAPIRVSSGSPQENQRRSPPEIPRTALPARGRNFWPTALVALITAAVILSAAVLIQRRHASGTPAARGEIALLVIPFDNLSGDPSQEYFSDGFTDEMIVQLGRQNPNHLKVFARTTSMQYKGTHKPLNEISRELNADVVLEGSVRRSGGHVRITAQLFQAQQQTSLWASSYEQDAANILQIQQEVAGEIAQSLALQLLPAERPKSAVASDFDPEAYDAYLLGLYEGNKRTAEALNKSIEYFKTAIRKGPRFAPAYAGLANFYIVAAGWGTLPPKDTLPKAREAALKATELDNSLADAHTALAVIHYQYDWNWSAAEAEFKQTLQQNPNSANCRKFYAEFLTHSGRLSEAMAEMKRARELDPLSPIINAHIAFIAYFQGRDAEAIAESQTVLNIAPNFFPAHYFMGLAYEQRGNYREAESSFRAAENDSGNNGDFLVPLAHNYAVSGATSQAKQLLATLESRSKQRYVSPFALAGVFTALGERDQACASLKKAYEDDASGLVFLKVDPYFVPLHGQPCYENLLKKLNFPL